MAEKGKKRCSFCGRTEEQVALLMTGMTGFICNDCVEQAHNILREEALLPKSDFDMAELPKPKEIKGTTYFKSVGMGLFDVCVAQKLLEKAKEN